jgi:glycosyltransferase involved in cell wall biosynthesis
MNAPSKKLLFIVWDGPYVTYLEGLFIPIFDRLQPQYELHIVQFSWDDAVRQNRITDLCKQRDIRYKHVTVFTKPITFLGKYLTLFRGTFFLANYIRRHNIDIVMPRSTMPAQLVLWVRYFTRKFKLVFDADGLPIEERVEFARLRRGSFRYKQLKNIERKIIHLADRVLTRSKRAINYLGEQHTVDVNKFSVVSNGRDESFFVKQSPTDISILKQKLKIPEQALVIAYVGSLGPQYGVEQMLFVHTQLVKRIPHTYLLILANNAEYMASFSSPTNVIIRAVGFHEIPLYLSIANVGLAIRKSSLAMMGVAPIKLGEYLLMGLPVIASAGIGDTEELLSYKPCVHILDSYKEKDLLKAINWIKDLHQLENMKQISEQASMLGVQLFSIQKSVDDYRKVLDSI